MTIGIQWKSETGYDSNRIGSIMELNRKYWELIGKGITEIFIAIDY